MPERLSSSKENHDSSRQSSSSSRSFSLVDDREPFASSSYDVKRKSDTLDRRKIDRSLGLGQIPHSDLGRAVGPVRNGITESLFLSSDPNEVKMTEPRQWRLSRARGPWSCSRLTLAVTIMGTALLLTILHAFFQRQSDPSGCIVPWTRPTYIAFRDFDTEHTRFATKYHLYLLRDGSYDEDPKVRTRIQLPSHND